MGGGARRHADQGALRPAGSDPATAPPSIVESGSLILMRELLAASEHLGCISRLQVQAETDRGLMTILAFEMEGTSRPIGLTLRAGWLPTRAQREFLGLLGATSPDSRAPA